jgi:hypothetical protein
MLDNAPLTSSALIKRNAVASVRWREDLPCAQEFSFFLDLALQGKRFIHVTKIVLEKRQNHRGESISGQEGDRYAETIGRVLVSQEPSFREFGFRENRAYDRGLIYYSNLLARRKKFGLAQELRQKAHLGRVLSSLQQRWSVHLFLTTILPPRLSARVYTLLGK